MSISLLFFVIVLVVTSVHSFIVLLQLLLILKIYFNPTDKHSLYPWKPLKSYRTVGFDCTVNLVIACHKYSCHACIVCCDHPHSSFCQFRRTTWTLLLVVSLLLLLDSGTLFHWTVELLHPLTHLRSFLRCFSLIQHNRTVARASVLWRDIYLLIDWLNLLAECCLRRHPEATVSSVHLCIGNYLKMAPHRSGGAGKGRGAGALVPEEPMLH